MQQNHLCNFERGHHGKYSCEVIWNLEQWLKRRCRLKTFPIWISDSPFVQRSVTIRANFGRGDYEEQFCEIILNLDRWFRRKCRSKVFFIWISGSPFVQRSVTICATSVEGIMRNNSVKLF